jgi:hypothetical protein
MEQDKKIVQENIEGEESKKLLPSDFYNEGDRIIFTEAFHIKRGSCCGNYCRHCPYEPRHSKGTKSLRKK